MTTTNADLDRLGSRIWDVLVIGAGPAGSVAGFELAKRGLSTLIVDQAEFPREKVCGGCLNAQAIAALVEGGLHSRLSKLEGPAVDKLSLWSGHRSLTLPIPAGLAISRFRLDQTLLEAAREDGAEFFPGVLVELNRITPNSGSLAIPCSTRAGPKRIQARMVVLATGLPKGVSDDPNLAASVAPRARVGIASVSSEFPDSYRAGCIFMAVGRGGYVGLTRIEDGRLNIAAAVDPKALKAAGSPGDFCRELVGNAGLEVSDALFQGAWRGTPTLTRRRNRSASHRLLAVGDAAGYVEPFTGAGMAWAIRASRAVVPFVERGLRKWDPALMTQWSQHLQQLLHAEQRKCRWLTRCLRVPFMVRSAMQVIRHFPGLGQHAVNFFVSGNPHEFHDLGIGNSGPALPGASGRGLDHVHGTALRK